MNSIYYTFPFDISEMWERMTSSREQVDVNHAKCIRGCFII